MPKEEIYISIDVEATGPIPGEYSMYEIGACVVGKEDEYYCNYHLNLFDKKILLAFDSICLSRLNFFILSHPI